MSNVCVCCLVISDVICQMFACVVSLSQMLYVKCLRVLSRYLRCYMSNVCVCCLVISDVICQMFACVVSLSQTSCKDLLHIKYLRVLSRYLRTVIKMSIILSGMFRT